MSTRIQLNTTIERNVHKLVETIAEHMYDFTHLFARRNGLLQSPEEQEIMKKTLEIAKTAIKDGLMTKIDLFNRNIGKDLDAYEEETRPLKSTRKN